MIQDYTLSRNFNWNLKYKFSHMCVCDRDGLRRGRGLFLKEKHKWLTEAHINSQIISFQNPCVSKQTCSECLQTPTCAWCMKEVSWIRPHTTGWEINWWSIITSEVTCGDYKSPCRSCHLLNTSKRHATFYKRFQDRACDILPGPQSLRLGSWHCTAPPHSTP